MRPALTNNPKVIPKIYRLKNNKRRGKPNFKIETPNKGEVKIIAKGLPLVYIFDETRNILLNNFVNYENLKQAYLLNLIYLTFGIILFYFSFLKARIKGTLINMGE